MPRHNNTPPKSRAAVPGLVQVEVLRLVAEEADMLSREARIIADCMVMHTNRRRGCAITQEDAVAAETQLALLIRNLDQVVENWTIASAAVLNSVPKARPRSASTGPLAQARKQVSA